MQCFFFLLLPFGCRTLPWAFFFTFDHLTCFCKDGEKSVLCYNLLFVSSSILYFSPKSRQACSERRGTFTLLTHIKGELKCHTARATSFTHKHADGQVHMFVYFCFKFYFCLFESCRNVWHQVPPCRDFHAWKNPGGGRGGVQWNDMDREGMFKVGTDRGGHAAVS